MSVCVLSFGNVSQKPTSILLYSLCVNGGHGAFAPTLFTLLCKTRFCFGFCNKREGGKFEETVFLVPCTVRWVMVGRNFHYHLSKSYRYLDFMDVLMNIFI